jgi:hypothetical protein
MDEPDFLDYRRYVKKTEWAAKYSAYQKKYAVKPRETTRNRPACPIGTPSNAALMEAANSRYRLLDRQLSGPSPTALPRARYLN